MTFPVTCTDFKKQEFLFMLALHLYSAYYKGIFNHTEKKIIIIIINILRIFIQYTTFQQSSPQNGLHRNNQLNKSINM